jgi:sulfotransferase 6B1
MLPTGTKTHLKLLRWQARRAQAMLRWGAGELARMPIVIGNSMPKSGSHLIIQILEGLPQIGPFVNPGMPPLNRNEKNIIQPEHVIIRKIQKLASGDFTYCYLEAKEPYISALTKPEIASIFVYRDPRDMIISHVFYATEMHAGHQMHHYYTEVLKTMEERIDAAISGVEDKDSPLSSIALKYSRYMEWLHQPTVLSLRFEDLILEKEQSAAKILDHLAIHGFISRLSRSESVNALTGSIEPKRSGTFRKGQPGNWREHFTEANKANFKHQTGDLLQRLGYEMDQDW